MRIVIFDIETDGLNPSVIWCIVTKELDEEPRVWLKKDFNAFLDYSKTVDLWVAHNGMSFDVPVVNRLFFGEWIDPQKVVDTFVVSRLVNYSGFSTHSLEELGNFLGFPKGKHTDWSQLSQEMVDYCIQDVLVTERVYKMYQSYIWDESWKVAMRIEHDMVLICNDMSTNGFKLNVSEAERLLSVIQTRMSEVEYQFQTIWPPELQEVSRIQYRVKLDGSLYSNVERAISNYPQTKIEGSELVLFDYVRFNPGSTKDRVDKLWQAGWQPTERTKTHNKFIRQAQVGELWGKTRLTQEDYDAKKENFERYGWTVGEENLSTLPESAPEGARRLAEWLTLEGRRSSLAEWLGCVSEDGRIHGKFWNIGAWTHRMSHSAPNQANIFSPFHGEPKNAVEEVKSEFDSTLRSLWCVDEGVHLVGTDAEGIQLRILAHYMQSDDYVHAITSGKKENETDIHNLNKRALGLNHINRDDAKTFIYAWLLGASNTKVGSILSCPTSVAKGAVTNFLESLPELKRLKQGKIPYDAARGFFVGLDGRKVLCDSTHLMLAGYLQNGEAVVMKHANRLWRQWADVEKIKYKQVDFVHDEWQTECHGSMDMAERLGELQRESIKQVGIDLGIYCPLAGSTDIGTNWLETH